MSTAFVRFGETGPRPTLMRLRNHAALVRTLLDELDRVAPPAGGAMAVNLGVVGQVAEEVARLGCRMLECAAAMAGEDVSSNRVAAFPLRRPGE